MIFSGQIFSVSLQDRTFSVYCYTILLLHWYGICDFCSSYVYSLRLIGPISYPGECDLMVHQQKYPVIFSQMHQLLPSNIYNMHQDTKLAGLIAVYKGSFNNYISSTGILPTSNNDVNPCSFNKLRKN